MEVVLLVIHLLIAIGLICVVLLQRSEGGALGIGGGGGGGMSGFMTGRSAANLLTRITAVLAAMFFLTSMGLTWLSGSARRDAPIVTPGTTAPPASSGPATPGPATTGQPKPAAPKGPTAPAN